MSLRKHGLKALGLSFLAAVSLMAIIAPGASAKAGKFLVNGSTSLNATASGKIDLLGVLLVPKITLEIDCLKFKVLTGTLTASTGHGLAELLYEECDLYAYEIKEGKIVNLQPDCGGAGQIYESALDRTKAVNEGNILAKALLLVLLHLWEEEVEKVKVHKEETIVKAEPKEGTTIFSKIFFKNCLISTVDITGAVDLLLHLGGDQVEHLAEEAKLKTRLNQLKYGEHEAFLDGAVWVFLTGAHEGMKWGIT